MNDKVDLTKGGIAVVMVGHTGLVKEYQNNASILFINCKETPEGELEKVVPTNTKVAIITDGLPKYHYLWMTSFCQRKNIPFLIRKSNQAVYETIKSFFPTNGKDSKPSIDEVKDSQVKGKLNILIQHIDWSKSNAENGRELLRKANQYGIKTTEGSLTQFVAVQRRKQSGITAVPRSVRSQLDISVEMLDESIKGLTDMREFLIATVEENRLLKKKVEAFKKLMDE